MSWYLVDDNLTENPKVLRLLSLPNGFAALGLWTLCGSWSRKYRTSGEVSAAAADASARKSGQNADASALAEALITAELWERTADGFQFVNWDDIYSEEDKAAERKKKDRERKARKRSGQPKDKHADASADIPPEIRRTPGSSPSPSPAPIDPPVVPQEPENQNTEPLDSDRPVSSAAIDETWLAIGEVYTAVPRAVPEVTNDQRRKVAKHVRDISGLHSRQFREAALDLAQAALAEPRHRGVWALLELDPYAPIDTGTRPAATGALDAKLAELQRERVRYLSGPEFSSSEQKRVDREIAIVERQLEAAKPQRWAQ